VDALDTDGQSAETTVNTYFAAHPENVLGALHLGHGMYNAATLEVRGDTGTELAAQVAGRLAAITADAQGRGLGLTATAETTTTIDAAMFNPGLVMPVNLAPGRPLDTLAYDEASNALRRWDGQGWVAHPARPAKVVETRKLLELRDIATTLIRAQRDGLPAGERDQLRGELNRVYDHYVAVHGPVNRFTWTNPKPITADKHDERMVKFEEQWRRKEGLDGLPYTGPVPEETRAAWGRAGVGGREPVEAVRAPGRGHPQRPRIRHRRRAGVLRRGHPTRGQGPDLRRRRAQPATGAHHRRHRGGSPGDQPG
jgi:hypothetical protein